MSSVLIISGDPNSLERTEEVVVSVGMRARTVSETSVARELLLMQDFDVVLVDSRFEETSIDLLELAWKQSPYTIGVLFNLQGNVSQEWNARLLGARVMAGPQALKTLASFLQSVTERPLNTIPGTVLLVEDLDAPRDILASYIESIGYPVSAAQSTDEALAALNTETRVFCVVTDLNMPLKGGLDLIRECRRTDGTSHLPIIVLTAYPTTDNLIECVRAGASGFLAKPPSKKALRRELEKAARTVFMKASPRLCKPEDVHHLEGLLARLAG